MMVYEMLTEAKLRTLKPQDKLYKLTDRDGLYIAVAPSGLITFRYNYRINGRQETLSVGRRWALQSIIQLLWIFVSVPAQSGIRLHGL